MTNDGNEHKFLLLVEGFGSKKGTLIITTDNTVDFKIHEKYGYYCSALNPLSYSKYNRENFIETLEDWDYFGESNEKPQWYNGHIYNNEQRI